MITARVIVDADGDLFGLHVSGHAGYAKHGRDIVCAAVSALTLNAVNSIVEYTDQGIICETGEDGLLRFKFENKPSHDSILLFKSMLLGLRNISEQYGEHYLRIVYLQKCGQKQYRDYQFQEV